MSEVKSIDPNEFIGKSNAELFQIFLGTNRQLMCYTPRGFRGVVDGFTEMHVYRKNDVVEAYYDAVRDAKSDETGLFNGTLVISELPGF